MKMVAIFPLIVVFICAQASSDQFINNVDNLTTEWPDGDPRKCLEHFRKSEMKVRLFEVMPGIGWDNLRNIEQGIAVAFTFKRCKVTDDGHFLIPDNIFTVPIKSSSVERLAQMIEHWHDASSITSNSVNFEAGLDLWKFGISGKFSYEHTTLKSKQIEDKAVTVRVQLRYLRYEARLQPDPVLSLQLKKRLLDMATLIESNQTERAEYEGQLLIRDFGTHVLTGITAGAGLVKDDFLKSEFVEEHSGKKSEILAAAGASFLEIFKLSASYGHKVDSKVDESYKNSLTHSFVQTLGGPKFKAENMTLNNWTSGVDSNLVAMDRKADPLNILVTQNSLPELSPDTIFELEKIVRESIVQYYEKNTIRGCTKIDFPNFSVSANLDDGSCYDKQQEMYFGGGFQQCAVKDDIDCKIYNLVNPLTNNYTCPTDHRLIQVLSTNKYTEKQNKVVVNNFWCYSDNTSHYFSFGGLFTKQKDNPFTNTAGCPAGYYVVEFFSGLSICVSPVPRGVSLPFGGFFSRNFGNPLFFYDIPRTSRPEFDANYDYPKSCPGGYSEFVATLDNEMDIHYCVLTRSLSSFAKATIKRPPFTSQPRPAVAMSNLRVKVKSQSPTEIEDIEKSKEHFQPTKANFQTHDKEDKEIDDSTSDNLTGASIATTLGSVLIAALVFVAKKKFHLATRTNEEVSVDPPRT